MDSLKFSKILRKAKNILNSKSRNGGPYLPLDGEIVYCKNNVCVHQCDGSKEPIPGYFTLRCQKEEVLGFTLILTWVPNKAIKNNPTAAVFSPASSFDSEEPESRHHSLSTTPISPFHSVLPLPTPLRHTPGPADEEQYNPEVDSRLQEWLSSSSKPGLSLNLSTGDSSSYPVVEVLRDKENLLVTSKDSAFESSESGPVAQFSSVAADLVLDQHTDVTNGISSYSSISSCAPHSPTSPQSPHGPLHGILHSQSGEKVNLSVSPCPHPKSPLVSYPPLTQPLHTSSLVSALSSHTLQSFPSCLSSSVNSPNDLPDNSSLHDHVNPSLCPPKDGPVLPLISNAADGSGNGSSDPSQHTTSLTSNGELFMGRRRGDSSSTVESSTSGSTEGPDSLSGSSFEDIQSPSFDDCCSPYDQATLFEGLAESFAVKHNLVFPASISNGRKPEVRNSDVLPFSVDLGLMRSLRLFYSNQTCTCGQLVIASRESQYKIFHFYHRGLEKLADVLEQWSLFKESKYKKSKGVNSKQFRIVRPQVSLAESQPEESVCEPVTGAVWKQVLNERGQVLDEYKIKKIIFFGGLHSSLRHEVWPFLLDYYPWSSTFEERDGIRNDKYIDYQRKRLLRRKMSKETALRFQKDVQCIVEKDVIRTDRNHPHFRGDDNPNISTMKNLLLTYAAAHPTLGYTQGMSDLVSPLIVEFPQEFDAYWCFEGLMTKTIFFSQPRDLDMEKQLRYLKEMLRLVMPTFYKHLLQVGEGVALLFVHRWILLSFKREFPEIDAMAIWEACWTRYQTDYFHIFICVAIISTYGEDVVSQSLTADEILLHFNNLSMRMNGKTVLKKARGLLHKFRTMERIPCTLHGLCCVCGPGMWDSGHVPIIQCTENHSEEDNGCPYL